MNSANCAYHRPPLLVLIAAVTTRLERRWALLPGAHRRQVILICGLFMCHSEGSAGWEMSGGLLEQNIRTRQAITDTKAICSYRLSVDQGQIKNSIKCRSHSSGSLAVLLNKGDINTQHEHMRQMITYYILTYSIKYQDRAKGTVNIALTIVKSYVAPWMCY